ncbi:MAG: hypothetical protein A2498_11620 [Lentisphaerae bacterium RIFOXYC12_FULL_60_16]|nr:MAG: hypothetical protein A2498_11620 [Lentisphaerae bacterium RIFOXYC12_FULL_60_16]
MTNSTAHRLLVSLAGLLTASILLAAPKPPPRPAPEADPGFPLGPILGAGWTNQWVVPATNQGLGYVVMDDEILKQPVLVVTGRTALIIQTRQALTSGIEIACQIRLAPDSDKPVSVTVDACKAMGDPKAKGHVVNVSGKRDAGLSLRLPPLPSNRFTHSNPSSFGRDRIESATSVRYELKAYPIVSPTIDPMIRASLEQDMASLPWTQDKWVSIRYQIGTDWMRIWVDDRLVADHTATNLQTHGALSLTLGPQTRLASCTITPLTPATTRFETIPLTGYVRDRTLTGNGKSAVGVKPTSLPFGSTTLIDRIPFSFADITRTGGADHLDVGRSQLREANMQGYGPVQSQGNRFADAFTLDPARLRFRIPNGRYEALYVVAASDNTPDSLPVFTAQFYRPEAGFAMSFEANVPVFTTEASDAIPVPVELDNGTKVRLWMVRIPLDPGKLSSFADMPFLELELTKRVEQYRSYPDPILYGWHGAGLPSAVHLYAMTLQRPAIDLEVNPAVFGHVWEAAPAVYHLRFQNPGTVPRAITLTTETRSADGTETTRQEQKVSIPAGRIMTNTVTVAVKRYGYHDIRFHLKDGDATWVEERSFVHLHPDTRAAEWSGTGPLFGYWGYGGGHYTPNKNFADAIMRKAGARAPVHPANAWPITPQRAWAGEDPLDPAQVAAYRTNAIAALRAKQGDHPDIVTFFAEPHISRDMTAGNLASYWNQPEPPLTEEEQKSVRVFFNTAKIAAEAVRETWPKTTILIPWGDPLFIVPILRAGFPTNLIDGCGIDVPGFERLPEQQLHQISVHRMYCLREEFRKAGIPNPKIWYVEGIFVPTEPGACTWQEQADYHDRWALINLAYGVDRFYSAWFAYDCGSYYGSEHYGGCGIQRRIPYCNPKPSYAHYATMTRQLEQATFDGWLPTGSLTTYCLRFKRPNAKGGPLYVLWNLRGKRPVTLSFQDKTTLKVTDPNDNTVEHTTDADNRVTIMTGPTIVYVAVTEPVQTVMAGAPDHTDGVAWARARNQQTWWTGPAARTAEISHEQVVARPGDGSWTLDDKPDVFDEIYENNNFDTKRYRGHMNISVVTNAERAQAALAVKLEQQDREIPLMPWYSVIRPAKPVTIPGAAQALGLWVQAASDWGRVVYCMKDANDEMWISIGTKDQWNCDNLHSWVSFNFDGWRYLRFELPGHAPWDNFREYGTTWWRYAGGRKEGVGVVDYPLRLEKIIVERRTHILYVNDIQPTGAMTNDVLLGDLVAEYRSTDDATDQAVALRRLRMPAPDAASRLPNPILELASANTLPATRITGIRNPDWGYDGTICHVDFEEKEGAVDYQVWVAAHPDGQGAVVLGRMKKSGGTVRNLAPAMKLHLWVTYTAALTDAEKQAKALPQQSKPSNRFEIELVDAFGQK